MSCLLLKGSSEHPAPPKEEVKGPEVGGCKRGHEREAEIIVNTEAADVHQALWGAQHGRHSGPGSLTSPPHFPPPSTAGVLWPVRSSQQTHRAGESSPVPRRASDMGWGWGAPCHPQGDIRSLLTPGSPGLPAHTSDMRPASPPSVSVRRWVRAAPDPLCARGLPDPVAQVRAHHSPVGTVTSGPDPPPASSCFHPSPHLPPQTQEGPCQPATERCLDRWVGRWVDG